MSEPAADEPAKFGADPKPYYLAFGLLVALEFVRRAFLGFVPDDFTAYLSAADTFTAGLNPYSDAIFEAERYNGKPYNYFPGTLYLIAWMSWVPTAVSVALDWVARITVLFFTLRYLHRRIVPDIGFHWVLVIAVLLEPLVIDLLFGNLNTYLLGAWAACAWISERERTPGRLLGAAASGVVVAFKPFWGVPVAYNFWVRRHWSGLASFIAGGAVVGGLSLLHLGWKDEFLAHTQRMREFYYSVDLLNLAPPLLVVAGLVWGGIALWLSTDEKRGEWTWLFGCTAIVIFPRLATYSYVLTLPLILYFVRRWGALRGLGYSIVLVGPLPWLLRVAPWMPGERLENWAHFSWCWVTMVVMTILLMRSDSPKAELNE